MSEIFGCAGSEEGARSNKRDLDKAKSRRDLGLDRLDQIQGNCCICNFLEGHYPSKGARVVCEKNLMKIY